MPIKEKDKFVAELNEQIPKTNGVISEPTSGIVSRNKQMTRVFDRSLFDIINQCKTGKIQLPEFQRDWVWSEQKIKALLSSIANSFPIGSIMILGTGGDLKFRERPLENIEIPFGKKAEELILDGQQRLTSLVQTIGQEKAVLTKNGKGNYKKKFFYIDIATALYGEDFEEAFITVGEDKIHKNKRKEKIDLSYVDNEQLHLMFPVNKIQNYEEWEAVFINEYANTYYIEIWQKFKKYVLYSFRDYRVGIQYLEKEISKVAVCTIFEKVNKGGVQLTVFDLLVASLAAEDFDLRKAWKGDSQNKGHYDLVCSENMLTFNNITESEFLQTVCLLKTKLSGESSSIKNTDVLKLTSLDYKKYSEIAITGFNITNRFLKREGFISHKNVPYKSQLVLLSAIFGILGEEKSFSFDNYDKISKWFWAGIIGEQYSNSVDSRIIRDIDELYAQLIDQIDIVPTTVKEAHFNESKFLELKTNRTVAFKGINALFIKNKAEDLNYKATISELEDEQLGSIEFHHIFPKKWCEENGINEERADCILNKMPISKKANGIIGKKAPSVYISEFQNKPGLNEEKVNKILGTHLIKSELLKKDEFDGFLNQRKEEIIKLMFEMTGISVQRNA